MSSYGFLLEHRPARGIWGGLWSFPLFDTEAAALDWLSSWHLDTATVAGVERLAPYSHAFTHFDLTLYPVLLRVPETPGPAGDGFTWYRLGSDTRIGLTKPVVDLISRLGATPGPEA